ncbi:MAG: DEAD/DEAH box helicase, partial [Myxococcales bacterium]|nr:DEAD/DEAH box helicase [Myxococcales bacterium]
TGSGKTLAAFLAALDALVRRADEGPLPDRVQVLYISPLRALSHDVEKNLQAPLEGIDRERVALGLAPHGIRSAVRTGDTSAKERTALGKRPPHILVTTPESFYLMLTSVSGRRMLEDVRTVIVDEIHAVAPFRRGAHLALSLARLDLLTGREVQRIGLSATQKPVETVARFLVGDETRPCTIVDVGHRRAFDIAMALPRSPLEGVLSNEVWEELFDQIAELVREHRTTLVFVTSRRTAERVAGKLKERLGEDAVTSHHGSLGREHRLDAEHRLKTGALSALVSTSSLELGIDIGDVELVVQLGSPRGLNVFVQRLGRSGHRPDATPKARIFPLSRDDLVECAALLACVRRGVLDPVVIPTGAMDVLAQQIVAMCVVEDQSVDDLFTLVRSAYPYRDLDRKRFDALVDVLAEGFVGARGRASALVHHDAVNGRLTARKRARMAVLGAPGTIPDTFEYEVRLEPDGFLVGTLHEDFAIESMAGDVFALGATSYRIVRVEKGTVRVVDAKG